MTHPENGSAPGARGATEHKRVRDRERVYSGSPTKAIATATARPSRHARPVEAPEGRDAQ
jgi:hypothetical protein